MSDTSKYVPPWIRYMQDDTGMWGFVIYRCAAYDDPERWARYRAALDAVLESAWQYWWRSFQHIGVTEEMYEMVRTRMNLHWVEDETMDGKGVDEVRNSFKKLQAAMPSVDEEPRLSRDPWNLDLPIPYHKDRQVALFVDEECISSLLGPPGQETPLPDTPAAIRKHARGSYIIGVEGGYSPERGYSSGQAPEPYSGWVKIAVAVIFTELCPARLYINTLLPLDKIYSQSFGVASSGGIWRG
ncbi:hypothetical protein BJX62DRAFT_246288 [Aspergillus germanicus]